MTPNEYRQKHKRCGTCKYWSELYLDYEQPGVDFAEFTKQRSTENDTAGS